MVAKKSSIPNHLYNSIRLKETHLWNNMFHHLRNEYVNQRYPEDLPGTVVEVNNEWADENGIQPGQVVEVALIVAGPEEVQLCDLEVRVEAVVDHHG